MFTSAMSKGMYCAASCWITSDNSPSLMAGILTFGFTITE